MVKFIMTMMDDGWIFDNNDDDCQTSSHLFDVSIEPLICVIGVFVGGELSSCRCSLLTTHTQRSGESRALPIVSGRQGTSLMFHSSQILSTQPSTSQAFNKESSFDEGVLWIFSSSCTLLLPSTTYVAPFLRDEQGLSYSVHLFLSILSCISMK